MVAIDLELGRHHLEQLLFNQIDIFARSETGAIANAEDVGIYGNGRPAKGGIEHHVGGLATDARQGLQRGTIFRYLAAVQF
ncbi:hypothetical protein D3C76_1346190 [compost metagenome]